MNKVLRRAFEGVEKHPDAVRTLHLDFFPLVANYWRPGTQYSANDIVRPLNADGNAYQADAAGQSGLVEPAWADGVTDGSVTWSQIAAGANGVTALTSPIVIVEPTGGITLGSPSVVDGGGTDTAIEVAVSDGVHGKDYRVECKATAGAETLYGSTKVLVRIK